jgi:hypothetical protein
MADVTATSTAATAVTRTPEQMKAYDDALSNFRNILIELVEGAREEKKPGSPSIPTGSTRNPIVWLNRYLNRVPEFEELVAKYTNILPTLDTDDGRHYSQMALVGIKALQRRKLEIAKTVYSEMLFQTTASANLGSTLLWVGLSIVGLITLGAIVGTVAKFNNINVGINNKDVIHLFVAFCFGCFGSVVSFLTRLSDFDSKQVRSKRFLLTYGLTLPIVGGGFALVLAAALDAGIISVLNNGVQLYIVIGFLAGVLEIPPLRRHTDPAS